MTPQQQSIAFDDALISRLTREHRVLEKLFADLSDAAHAQDGVAFERMMRTCEFTLKVHHKLEDDRMYGYLLQAAQGSPRVRQMVAESQRAMNNIARNVTECVTDYLSQDPARIDFARASLDMQDIRLMLGERIQREESDLYPLYQESPH